MNLWPILRSHRPAHRHRKRVRRNARRNSIPRRKKQNERLLIDVPVTREDHLLSGLQHDVREALSLETKHDSDFLDICAGESDVRRCLQVPGVVWGFGLPGYFDFEGMQAGESEVEFRDGFDESVEVGMIVVFAVSGGDVQAEMLQFVDGELLGEEER